MARLPNRWAVKEAWVPLEQIHSGRPGAHPARRARSSGTALSAKVEAHVDESMLTGESLPAADSPATAVSVWAR